MAIQRSGRFERIKKPLKSEMNVVPYIDVYNLKPNKCAAPPDTAR